jgi:hypothetical protein
VGIYPPPYIPPPPWRLPLPKWQDAIDAFGNNGTPFLIGDRYEGSHDGDGNLHLQIVPSQT